MSLEEKYHNVNVTFGMAYTVDMLNPEDVINEEYVEQYLEPALFSQVMECPQNEAERIINDKSQLLYDDIDTFMFVLKSRLKRHNVIDFSSKKDNELTWWVNRSGQVAIECNVHVNFMIDDEFMIDNNFVKARRDLYNLIYSLEEEYRQDGSLSAFITTCRVSL